MNGDPVLTVAEVAPVEFFLRTRLGDPCKSSFNAKQLAGPLDTHPSAAGRSLAAIAADPPPELDVERRPGGRGGARYGFSRRREDVSEPRRFWIERGERVREGPA